MLIKSGGYYIIFHTLDLYVGSKLPACVLLLEIFQKHGIFLRIYLVSVIIIQVQFCHGILFLNGCDSTRVKCEDNTALYPHTERIPDLLLERIGAGGCQPPIQDLLPPLSAVVIHTNVIFRIEYCCFIIGVTDKFYFFDIRICGIGIFHITVNVLVVHCIGGGISVQMAFKILLCFIPEIIEHILQF